MEKKKVFVTLFPPCENIHLIKDVGMIPFLMHKNHSYDSYIATCKNGDYPYLKTDVKGLKLKFIERKGSEFMDSVAFIRKEAKNIDVLQVFHFSFKKLLLLNLFMLLRGKGAKTYIKLDANQSSKEINYTGLKKLLLKGLIKNVTLVSAETREITDLLNHNNSLSHKVELIPNGFYPKFETFDKKANIILTVGRIGDVNKNNKILVDSFLEFYKSNKNWKLYLVGSVEPYFREYLNEIFRNNLDLNGSIVLTGPITDRVQLREIYLKSKIFALTSLSEGFPLVFTEALNAGCIIVSSNLSAGYDITENGIFGEIYKENKEKNLQVALENAKLKAEKMNWANFEHHKELFYWPNIVNKISEKINLN